MEPTFCGSCGAAHSAGASRCPQCGAKLSGDVEVEAARVTEERQVGIGAVTPTVVFGTSQSLRARRRLDLVAIVGFVALAAIGAYAWSALRPAPPSAATYTGPSLGSYVSDVAGVLSEYELNNLSAESAPQQQVVNGWVAKDLLVVLARQQDDLLAAINAVGRQAEAASAGQAPTDERVPAFLLLALAAVCWTGVTATLRRALL